jgi:hypothetical protein
LERLAGNRLTGEGVIVITANRFRSQMRNREDARERLIALVRQAATPPKPRRKTKPPRSLEAAPGRGEASPLHGEIAARAARYPRSDRSVARGSGSRLASNRNHVRRSVASMNVSSRLAVPYIAVLVAERVGLAHGRGHRLVVGHQLEQHVVGRNERLVVVLEGLMLGDVPQSSAA